MTALFAGLFDDAALFPPGDAPMVAAVPAHRELRARLGDLVGPFVVPAARLGELSAHLGDGEPVDISLIAAAGDLPAVAARVAGCPGLTLTAVEVPVVADATAARDAVRVLDDVLPAGVPAAVELPRSAARDEVLDVLAGTGHRAKLRTGGVRAALFPPPEELAGTLAACVAYGVPLKCTAGLALAAYFVAVFPANVYVAVADVAVDGQPGGWYPWLRLPFQVLFVAWALWSTEWDLQQLRSAAKRLVGRTPRAEEVSPAAPRAQR